ncbi:MAG: exodeoxyribonuclease III [Alphaproteobacteria bacterium]|nr:exodeoxyribonuclease III [Alphaproteobacteria bacterium]
MKIATFNVNDINKRLANLLDWLRTAKPDVVCLQELKAGDAAFPRDEIARAGYHAAWRGQKTWNGVAILARDCEPVVTRTALPGDPNDTQSRYIEAAVNGVIIASLYAPNGNPQPGPKFKYKLAWMQRLIAHAASLRKVDVPVVLAGDYNVVPTDRDIYPTTSYRDNALVQLQPRRLFQELLAQGWTDAIRARHPDEPIYTFWDYRRNRWPRDAGLRLDHLLLSPQAASRLSDCGIDRDARGVENASDHAPVWIALREARQKVLPRVAKALPNRKPAVPKAVAKSRTKAVAGPLLAIDGDSFAHRAYHALPKNIRKADGSPAGAILGFANILLRLWREEQPRAVLVGWDTLDKPTYRHRQFPAYQSGRQFDEDLLVQFKDLRTFVAACGFANARAAGYEADDFLAAAAMAGERGGTVVIASGDRDTFQLASDRTTILFPVRGGGMLRIGPAEVRERYGVGPHQVPDFIALRGDPSDRLPGAPGVGSNGAAELLRRHGTLEAALKAGRFPGQAQRLRLFRAIATMNRKAPLPTLSKQQPTWAKAARLARRWGLIQLANRIDELAAETKS